MVSIDFSWIIQHLAICYFGIMATFSMYYMSKEAVKKKHREYGEELHNLKLSYRKAYINSFLSTIVAPVMLSGFFAFLVARSRIEHFFDVLIVALVLTIPPTILGLKEAIEEMVKKAENEDN